MSKTTQTGHEVCSPAKEGAKAKTPVEETDLQEEKRQDFFGNSLTDCSGQA